MKIITNLIYFLIRYDEPTNADRVISLTSIHFISEEIRSGRTQLSTHEAATRYGSPSLPANEACKN